MYGAAVTSEIWPAEPVEALLGIEPISQTPTSSVVELTVATGHSNAHGICHGGIMFLLADAAMGRASNTAAPSLASHAEIDFMAPVPIGTRLRARAVMRINRRKLRIWDVEVAIVDGDGNEDVIAEFRGRTIEVAAK